MAKVMADYDRARREILYGLDESGRPLESSDEEMPSDQRYVTLLKGHDPIRPPGQEVFKISRVGWGWMRSGPAETFSSSYGSSQVTMTRPDPTRPDNLT